MKERECQKDKDRQVGNKREREIGGRSGGSCRTFVGHIKGVFGERKDSQLLPLVQ